MLIIHCRSCLINIAGSMRNEQDTIFYATYYESASYEDIIKVHLIEEMKKQLSSQGASKSTFKQVSKLYVYSLCLFWRVTSIRPHF